MKRVVMCKVTPWHLGPPAQRRTSSSRCPAWASPRRALGCPLPGPSTPATHCRDKSQRCCRPHSPSLRALQKASISRMPRCAPQASAQPTSATTPGLGASASAPAPRASSRALEARRRFRPRKVCGRKEAFVHASCVSAKKKAGQGRNAIENSTSLVRHAHPKPTPSHSPECIGDDGRGPGQDALLRLQRARYLLCHLLGDGEGPVAGLFETVSKVREPVDGEVARVAIVLRDANIMRNETETRHAHSSAEQGGATRTTNMVARTCVWSGQMSTGRQPTAKMLRSG